MKKILALLFLVSISILLFSQETELKKANTMLNDRGEISFRFPLNDQNLNVLANKMSLDKVSENFIYAYANENEFNYFLDLNSEFEVLTPPSMMFPSILENASRKRDISSFDYYPSWNEYLSIMDQFVSDYPDICELVNIGQSNQGRDILMIHINDDLSSDQVEPEFLYTSSIHGDELVGYILTLRLIDFLLSNYGTDPDATFLVNHVDIYINPLANPDGTFAGGNNSVWGATRGNSNYIDLNRNYADPEDGPHPDGNEWQTETVHFMDFAEQMDFVMGANMHGGAEVVNYPWDTWPQLAADDNWWIYVSREYADLVHDYGWQGYLTEHNNGITNGYQWYSISGGRQDYMNYFENCREVTLELSGVKTPPESQLDNFWNANFESLIAYMRQVTNGVSGVVTSAITGNGVPAKVWVNGHDKDNSEVYANIPLGNYNRLLKAGNYDITFSSFGFYDETFNIDIVDDQNLELNVEMMPLGTLIPDFASSATIAGTGSSIDFFDESIGYDIVSWEWTFEGAETGSSTDQNPDNIVYNSNGTFDVTLKITNLDGNTDTKYMADYVVIKEPVIIDNGSFTLCDAVFYDSGAENSDYSDDEDYIITFYPIETNQLVILEFIDFQIENSWDCENDYFQIFDGTDTDAPLLGTWCGSNGPIWQVASNENGALTVLFHSNSSITNIGWKAVVQCDSNVGTIENQRNSVTIFPNPARNTINIISDEKVSDIMVSDLFGNNITNQVQIINYEVVNFENIDSGIYLISFEKSGDYYVEKVFLTR